MEYSPKKFNIKYKAHFDSYCSNNNIRIWVSEPLNSPLQKIESFNISHKPQHSYKDQYGNKIMYLNLKNTDGAEIQFNIKVELWKNKIDINHKRTALSRIPSKLLHLYTKEEPFLEHTPQIKKLTYQITANDKSVLEKVNSIFNFVVKNFEYSYPVKHRGVKYLNLKKLTGDCAEYSGLFVTMCRILKIPAKNVTGFVIFAKPLKINEHGWASIYLEPYGWIDVDPQYASLEQSVEGGIKKYFCQRSDYRIVFTNGFNIPLSPKIPDNFQTDNWGKNEPSISNSTAQSLQPLIFASKERVRFREITRLIGIK